MYTRLMCHLTKYNILFSEQYSCKKNLTTDNATNTLTNEILTAMNNKSQAGGIFIFCDVKKGSDCVNHNILLLKMEFHGIIGKDKNTLYTISYR
jgi:hypothetical protein